MVLDKEKLLKYLLEELGNEEVEEEVFSEEKEVEEKKEKREIQEEPLVEERPKEHDEKLEEEKDKEEVEYFIPQKFQQDNFFNNYGSIMYFNFNKSCILTPVCILLLLLMFLYILMCSKCTF